MTVLSNINYFKELPFYNKPINQPKIKRLKNIDLLTEQPFYEKLNIMKTNQAFRGYAMSQKVEIIERKDLILQLKASKLSNKDFFSNLLDETKGFKYQITVKVLLKKYKHDGEIEFAPICFNSLTKTIMLFKKFYTVLIIGLMKDLVGLLNQSNHNTLIFQLIGRYQEVLTLICLLN